MPQLRLTYTGAARGDRDARLAVIATAEGTLITERYGAGPPASTERVYHFSALSRATAARSLIAASEDAADVVAEALARTEPF